MKARDLKDLTYEEIAQKREEIIKEKFNLRLRQATRQIDNPVKVRLLRRDLARINTILHEHELGLRNLAEGKPGTTDRQAENEK